MAIIVDKTVVIERAALINTLNASEPESLRTPKIISEPVP